MASLALAAEAARRSGPAARLPHRRGPFGGPRRWLVIASRQGLRSPFRLAWTRRADSGQVVANYSELIADSAVFTETNKGSESSTNEEYNSTPNKGNTPSAGGCTTSTPGYYTTVSSTTPSTGAPWPQTVCTDQGILLGHFVQSLTVGSGGIASATQCDSGALEICTGVLEK